MNILALDSSTEACSVALLTDQGVSERFEVIGRGHAEHLLPMIDDLLDQNDAALENIDLFASNWRSDDAGPGTGARV